MKKIKRLNIIISAFLMGTLLFGLCACDYGKDKGEPYLQTANKNSISIGVYNFDTYNPIATVSTSVTQTSSLIFDSLVRRKGDQRVELCLCEGYTISDGGLTYTFKLRDGIKWHDGEAFSAADVDYTFKMIQAIGQGAYKSRLNNVKEYRRDGKDTFIVNLWNADGGFISYMDIPIIKSGTDCENNLKQYIPIGTGAYKYVDSDVSKGMRLVRNEEYTSAQKPLIEEIIIKQLPTEDALATALEAREVEVASFTAQQMRSYNPKGNLNSINYSNNALTFIGINTDAMGLDSSYVRRAISYAIDRKYIAEKVFFGRAQATNLPISPDSYLYKPIYEYERDTEWALQLLTQAGYSMGSDGIMKNDKDEKLSFSLLINLGNELRQATAEKIKTDLKQIGIDVQIKRLEFADYEEAINEREYDLFIGEVKIGTNHNLSMFVGENASYGVYSSERVNSLLRACRTASDAEAFEDSYNELSEVFLSEMPVVSVVMGTDVLLLNSKIKGAGVPAYKNIFTSIDTWYIENE